MLETVDSVMPPTVLCIGPEVPATLGIEATPAVIREMACILEVTVAASRIEGLLERKVAVVGPCGATSAGSTVRHDGGVSSAILTSIVPRSKEDYI